MHELTRKEGATKGPPAEREYAVLPVGDATMTPLPAIEQPWLPHTATVPTRTHTHIHTHKSHPIRMANI